jgi:hypothetical protein
MLQLLFRHIFGQKLLKFNLGRKLSQLKDVWHMDCRSDAAPFFVWLILL